MSDTKNQYLSNVGIAGLFENLLCDGRCPEGAAPTVAFSHMSRERLAAIAQQAENVLNVTLGNIAALGKVTAVAAYTEELDHGDMADMGWLTNFLAEVVEQAMFMKEQAEDHLANPDQSRRLRYGS